LVYLKALLLIPQDPDVVGGLGSPILFVAWSLQYEMLFYAVFALFIAHRGLGLIAAAALLWVNLRCQFGTSCAFPASFVANNMIFLFAMGVGAAYFVRSRLWLPNPLALALLAAGAFVGFGAYEVWVGRESLAVDRRLAFGALATVLIIALARAEDAGAIVLKPRWPALFGDASYALYLLHIPVISVLCKLLLQAQVSNRPLLVGAFVAVALGCVVAAVGFHLLIERPMLARLRFASSHSAHGYGAARRTPVT
jgi:exopolysaccharide production protein ExoZ